MWLSAQSRYRRDTGLLARSQSCSDMETRRLQRAGASRRAPCGHMCATDSVIEEEIIGVMMRGGLLVN